MNQIKKLQSQLKKQNLSAVLITNRKNVHYLSGFNGSNGMLLVTPKKVTLITDFRYFVRAKKQLRKGISLYDQKKGLKGVMGRLQTIGFEDQGITVYHLQNLKKALPKKKWKPIGSLVEEMRMIKDSSEIKIMKKGCALADKCLKRLSKSFKIGVTEAELTSKLLLIAYELGAEEFSFDPIITFGKGTADVHHQKENKKLKKGEHILIDMGIKYKGYCTDMTRVFFLDKASKKIQEIHKIVLEANQKAINSIKVGMKCGEVDSIARGVIEKAGYGDHFGHSTGHGVGVEIHEMPNISPKSDIVIKPGMVFTIEPGIYIEGVGGVRIEDMVYIKPNGAVEVLTKYKK